MAKVIFLLRRVREQTVYRFPLLIQILRISLIGESIALCVDESLIRCQHLLELRIQLLSRRQLHLLTCTATLRCKKLL